MKKLFNYSFFALLCCLFIFACSKEDGEMNPASTLKDSSVNNLMPAPVNIGGFNIECIKQNGSQWYFTIKPGARYGLSNLQLELLECPSPGKTVELSTGSITSAFVMIQGISYELTPIYNSDGSCVGIKGDDFTSFVKFELNGGLDDLIKQRGGTLYFVLADANVVLYGANMIVKTGGKDNKCYRDIVLNCVGCNPPPPVVNCSFSQGRFFNPGNDGKNWPEGVTSVTVGNKTVQKGEMTLPATNPADRAFLQAATLILSGTNIAALPDDVEAAFNYIVAYYSGLNDGSHLQTMAGKIGNWIDRNHC